MHGYKTHNSSLDGYLLLFRAIPLIVYLGRGEHVDCVEIRSVRDTEARRGEGGGMVARGWGGQTGGGG